MRTSIYPKTARLHYGMALGLGLADLARKLRRRHWQHNQILHPHLSPRLLGHQYPVVPYPSRNDRTSLWRLREYLPDQEVSADGKYYAVYTLGCLACDCGYAVGDEPEGKYL